MVGMNLMTKIKTRNTKQKSKIQIKCKKMSIQINKKQKTELKTCLMIYNKSKILQISNHHKKLRNMILILNFVLTSNVNNSLILYKNSARSVDCAKYLKFKEQQRIKLKMQKYVSEIYFKKLT